MAFMDEMNELALNEHLSPSAFLFRLAQLREKYKAGTGQPSVTQESAYSTCKREDIPTESSLPKAEIPTECPLSEAETTTECPKIPEPDLPIPILPDTKVPADTKVPEPTAVVTKHVIKKEQKMKKIIQAINPPVSFVREQIEKAGSNFGSVRFIKRTDGTERRMCYKLHVANPKYVKAPKYINTGSKTYQIEKRQTVNGVEVITFDNHKVALENNHLMTVFDVNLPIRDKEGKVTGKRGGYRSVPLNAVTRICAAGNLVEIEWT